MAKVKGPMLSLGASGQIGKAIVFGNWKGVDYARSHVTPANPQSVEQTVTRDLFSSLTRMYKRAVAQTNAPWKSYASGKPLTDRNAFTKFNLPDLRGETTSALFTGSPGSLGGVAPSSIIVATGTGSGALDVTVVNFAPPTGWVLASVDVLWGLNVNPNSLGGIVQRVATDATPTAPGSTVFNLTGGTPATSHFATAWNVWTRPDGRTAYSPSLVGVAVTGA